MAGNQGDKSHTDEFAVFVSQSFRSEFDAPVRVFGKLASMAARFNIQLLMDRLRILERLKLPPNRPKRKEIHGKIGNLFTGLWNYQPRRLDYHL